MDESKNDIKKNNNILPIVVVIALVLVLTAGVIGYQSLTKKETAVEQQSIPSVAEETQATLTTASSAQMYKDGTYSATGNYTSPGGAEELGVTVTLTNGVITDATVEPKAFRITSKVKQEDFAANYKPFVIGKNINEVQLTKVSGSSLSPKGFNDALEQIKTQAQS